MTIPNNNQKPATISDVAVVMAGRDEPQSQTYTEGVGHPIYQAGQSVGTVDKLTPFMIRTNNTPKSLKN